MIELSSTGAAGLFYDVFVFIMEQFWQVDKNHLLRDECRSLKSAGGSINANTHILYTDLLGRGAGSNIMSL